MRRATVKRALLVVTVTASFLAPAVAADARVPRCFGERATIVGTNRAEDIRGTSGDDVIVALGGADVIEGRGGDDRICGGNGDDRIVAGGGRFDVLFGESGDDELLGGGGFDVLQGGLGDDSIDGGPGSLDVVSFFASPVGVTADLTAGTASGEGSDVLEAVEQVEGSAFDDTLTGDGDANTFYPGGGDDVLDGGDGLDSVRYVFAPGPVIVDLTGGTATGDGSDVLTAIESIDGSDFADVIAGDANPNIIGGGQGNDVITGADGDDYLFGEDGDDDLDGGVGNDTLDGGDGTDACANGENVSNCEG